MEPLLPIFNDGWIFSNCTVYTQLSFFKCLMTFAELYSYKRLSAPIPGTPSSASVTKKPVFQFERFGSLVRKNSVVKKREQEAIDELDSEKDR